MSGYVLKVGDRVRATLGENVLVGTWGVSEGGLCNRIVLDSGHVIGQEWDGWQFEQVVEVPTKFGAVIRKPEGDVWVQHGDGQWYDVEGCECTNADIERGGFTVLFEGVDE